MLSHGGSAWLRHAEKRSKHGVGYKKGRVAVSRILSVAEATGRPFLSLRLRATPRSRGVRLLPGMCPACAERPGRAVIPVLSCTARGLSCHDDHSSRGGLLPRHFNLTRRGGRYIFCDTIRGGGLASVGPALARGVLPRGVRTFLCAGKPRSGRRPPAGRKLCHPRFYRNLASRGRSLLKAET